jgi:hypothetical protein
MAAAGARAPVQNPAYASTRPPRATDHVFIDNGRFGMVKPTIIDENAIIRGASSTGKSVGGGQVRCRAQIGVQPADQ